MSELKESKAIALVNQKVDESNISDPQLADQLKHFFGPMYDQAMEAFAPLKGLEVTSEDQVEEMKKAREGASALGKIRIEVEKKRKVLKADSLAMGKAIDGVAKMITEFIEPAEKHLKLQADFIEIKAANARLNMINERRDKLMQYCPDPTMFDIGNMSEPAFESLLEGQKLAFESRQRLALEQKKTDDRIYELGKIGLVWNEEHQSFIKHDSKISMEDVKKMSDKEFVDAMDSIENEQQKRIAIREKDSARRIELRNLGYSASSEDSISSLRYGLMEDDTYARLVDELKEENAQREKKVAIDSLTNSRTIELLKFGYDNPTNLIYGELTEQEYADLLAEVKKIFELNEQQRRDQEKQHRISTRKLQLTEMGFSYDSVMGGYVFPNPDCHIYKLDELSDIDQNFWNAFIEKDEKTIAAAVLAKEKADKKLAKAPDRDKMKVWVNKFQEPDIDAMGLSQEALKLGHEIIEKFNGFKKWAFGEIEKL